MKYFILIVLALVPMMGAEASNCRIIVPTGGAPIPTTYVAANTQSLVFSGLKKGLFRDLIVINALAASICFNHQEGTTTVAPNSALAESDGTTRSICLPSGINFQSDTHIMPNGSAIYLRSNTGAALTTGYIEFCTF